MIYWDTSCVLKLYTAESDSILLKCRAVATADLRMQAAASLLSIPLFGPK